MSLTVDAQNEIDLDSSIAASSSSGTKTHEKQLVSEIADSAEDNTNDI